MEDLLCNIIFLKHLRLITCLLLSITTTYANTTITLYDTANPTNNIGMITASNTRYGLLLTPQLTSLPPGLHGFHLHAMANCADQGMAAGGHFDPQRTNTHLGPYANGHLGDLPALYVDANGRSTLSILAPRLTEKDLVNHALIIHAGGDNYSDSPEALGGGGKRIACGVVK